MRFAALLAASVFALSPFAQANQGEQCMQHLATATDPNGNPLVCVHGPDTGHIMYWYPGTANNYPGL